MNVETANRLMQYRKKAGLSQEELADKLGVSRQAVSKWECAESSPDTDNLIALSKIYGVSLDELINDEPKQKEEKKKEGLNIHLKDNDGSEVNITGLGIHVKSEDGDEVHVGSDGVEIIDGDDKKLKVHVKGNKHFHTAESLVSSLTVLGVVIAYLLIGFLAGGWGQWWVLFLLIPITPTIVPAIMYRKFTIFNYPVAITMVYLSLGVFCDLWHPLWVLFLTIPVYYIVFGPVDKVISKKIKVDGKIVDAHDYDEDND